MREITNNLNRAMNSENEVWCQEREQTEVTSTLQRPERHVVSASKSEQLTPVKKARKRTHDELGNGGQSPTASLSVEETEKPDVAKVKKNPASVAKRNARERRRIKNVNLAFDELRQHVPLGEENKKISKVDTLQSAIEYIKALESLVKQKKEKDSCNDNKENAVAGTPRTALVTPDYITEACRTLSASELRGDEYAQLEPCARFGEKKSSSESQHHCLHNGDDNLMAATTEHAAGVDISDECRNGNIASDGLDDDSGYSEKSVSTPRCENQSLWRIESTISDESSVRSVADTTLLPTILGDVNADELTRFLEGSSTNLDLPKYSATRSQCSAVTPGFQLPALTQPSASDQGTEYPFQEVDFCRSYSVSQPLCSTPSQSQQSHAFEFPAQRVFSSDFQHIPNIDFYGRTTY